jgi:hypothetical protein
MDERNVAHALIDDRGEIDISNPVGRSGTSPLP